MAYMSQELKKELAPSIKKVLKKWGFKGSISVENHMKLVVTLREGPLFPSENYKTFRFNNSSSSTADEKRFLAELLAAMNEGNHDNSDRMTDYFDVGWYVEINIGRWDKSYNCTMKKDDIDISFKENDDFITFYADSERGAKIWNKLSEQSPKAEFPINRKRDIIKEIQRSGFTVFAA